MLTVAISLLGLESKLRLRQVNGDFGDRRHTQSWIFCESIFCSSAKSSYRKKRSKYFVDILPLQIYMKDNGWFQSYLSSIDMFEIDAKYFSSASNSTEAAAGFF